VSEPDQSILQVFDGYKAAVFAKDVDAFMALFGKDVHVFDMWVKWSYEGDEAWRGMAAGWFGSLGTERVDIGFDDIRTIVSQGVAVAHAFVTYTALAADGKTLRSLQNRLTWALARQDGAWKVVHEHSSAPADFATGKVILKR
jgi:uncharacterized protein (TIGR02246 family)